jgi:hypothetical protein
LALPGLLLGTSGCKCGSNWTIDNCAVIEKGALPEQNGVFVREYQYRQTTKAERDDFVIYNQEWYLNGKELGPFGQYHLDQIIQRLPRVPFPVVVQLDPDPDLNKARWEVIVAALGKAGIPMPETRVFIGRPEAEGLYGDEAPRIYGQMISSPSYGHGGGYGYGTGFGGFGASGSLGGFGGGFGGLGGFGGY